MHRTVALICVLLIFVSCSRRVEQYSHPTQPSPNAININTATVGELERLPYVGRKTAESIIAFREQNGPFRRVEQLLMIRGVSEKRFVELRPMLRTE